MNISIYQYASMSIQQHVSSFCHTSIYQDTPTHQHIKFSIYSCSIRPSCHLASRYWCTNISMYHYVNSATITISRHECNISICQCWDHYAISQKHIKVSTYRRINKSIQQHTNILIFEHNISISIYQYSNTSTYQ